MTTTSLPIDQLIRVDARVELAVAAQEDFGRSLMITADDNILGGTGRAQTFASLEAVARVFPTTSQPYATARSYFSVVPYPRPLVVGRFATAAATPRIRGGSHNTLTQIQALGDTNTLTVGGITTAAIALSAVASFAAVATAVQGAIRTASALINAWAVGTTYAADDTVEGSDGNFYAAVQGNVGQDPVDDDSETYWTLAGPNLDAANVSYTITGVFVLASGGVSNEAIAALPTGSIAMALGWTDAAGARTQRGYAADTNIAAAYTAILRDDSSWHWVGTDASITDPTVLELLSTTVQASGHRSMASLDVVDPQAIVANDATSLAARLFALEQSRVVQTYSARRDGKGLAFAGRMSSVNFDGVQTAINPQGKQLPGTTPDNLDLDDVTELTRKRCNYYARRGDTPIFQEGWTTNTGTWVDVQYFLNWFVNDIQRRLFNLVTLHPTRLPQTEEGLAAIQRECERACQQGVRNGNLAEGRQVSEAIAGQIRAAIGNPDFDGVLTRGFLVHIPSIRTLSTAQRVARRMPPVSIWLASSGAINYVSVDLILAQ